MPRGRGTRPADSTLRLGTDDPGDNTYRAYVKWVADGGRATDDGSGQYNLNHYWRGSARYGYSPLICSFGLGYRVRGLSDRPVRYTSLAGKAPTI